MDKMNKMNKMMLPLWVVGAFLCLSINLSAQQFTPVGAEFNGQWTFKSAQAQERPLNEKEPYTYTARAVVLEDLQRYSYFHQIPTQISITEGGMVQAQSHTMAIRATATLNENMLEFVADYDGEPDDNGETPDYVIVASYYETQLSGNTLSFKYQYLYGTDEGGGRKYTVGTLIIQYNR